MADRRCSRMKTKILLRIAAAIGALVLVGGISVAAMARSGSPSHTPKLPVVNAPTSSESDATETPEPTETESPEPTDTESPEADEQGEDQDADDQGENDNSQ